MALGQDPGFKREARRVRRQSNKVLVLQDHAHSLFSFLAGDLAIYAALLIGKVARGAVQLFAYLLGHNGQGHDLRRRLALVAGTERTKRAAFYVGVLTREISRTLGAVSGNDDPATGDGIFAKFRHREYLTTGPKLRNMAEQLFIVSS